MDTDKWTVDKLKSDNYKNWKFQMKHLLWAKGFYEIVTGAEKEPATGDKEIADFKKRTVKAVSVVHSLWVVNYCIWLRIQKDHQTPRQNSRATSIETPLPTSCS